MDADHSLWRALASWTGSRCGVEGPMKVHALTDGGDGWREHLSSAVERVDPGGQLLVAYDRGAVAQARRVRAGRRAFRAHMPTTRSVMAFLDAAGCPVGWRFGVWPTVEAPRIAFPCDDVDGVAWLQSTGLWGGGGDSLLLRLLARRAPRPQQLRSLTPGVALITARDGGSGA